MNNYIDESYAYIADLLKSQFRGDSYQQQPDCVVVVGYLDKSLIYRIHETMKLIEGYRRQSSGQKIKTVVVNCYKHKLDTNQLSDCTIIDASLNDPGLLEKICSVAKINLENALFIYSFIDLPAISGQQLSVGELKEGTAHKNNALTEAGACKLWKDSLSRFGFIVLQGCSEFYQQEENYAVESNMHKSVFCSSEQLILVAARSGFFLKPNFYKKYPKSSSVTQISVNFFEHRDYCVRYAETRDIPELIELEHSCWIDAMCMSQDDVQKRLKLVPYGNCVLEYEGQVVAVVYSQRIDDINAIKQSCDTEVLSLHNDNGKIAQLIKLNVLPEKQPLGLGDQLLEFMLQRFHMANNIEAVVAVTRCKNYPRYEGIPLADYIYKKDDKGQLLDPILRFHHQHGAVVDGLIANYRPGDEDNQAYGVLVKYDINHRSAGECSMFSGVRGNQPGFDPKSFGYTDIAGKVKEYICAILAGDQQTEFSITRPLMEMGLDSLDLSQLRKIISRYWGVELDSTFFFNHISAQAVTDYIYKFLNPDNKTADDIREKNSLIQEKQSDQIIATEKYAESQYKHDDVAIIGLSFRFPGDICTVEQFWDLLENQNDVLAVFPENRFDPQSEQYLQNEQGARFGGFLHDIADFDAGFFRISPKEAELMDPQQRLLLEQSWAALEDAGYCADELAGSTTGVFIGACHYDYRELLELNYCVEEGHFSTGTEASILSNRLSYFYNFHGPSLTIDTACSSSLVALHEAVKSINHQECDLAFSGGVNLICSTTNSLAYQQAGMLADDGKCKTFSSDANGYARGEGVAILLLKSLSLAIKDQDQIYAVIKGSSVNHGGEAASLTAPNSSAQASLLVEAYEKAKIPIETVSYIEAHGTGTPLGDPIEIEGIKQAFSRLNKPKDSSRPCAIGSVKTNIGHLESAAGLAGVIKVLLAMKYESIPGNVNFQGLNPNINLSSTPFYIAEKTTHWQRYHDTDGQAIPFRAGVSSFGFGGANAHVVLEEMPAVKRQAISESEYFIVTLSAKNEPCLQKNASNFSEYLQARDVKDMNNIAYTAALGRKHFDYRLAVVGNKEAISTGLQDFMAGRETSNLFCHYKSSVVPEVAFMFTGQGSQYAGMGRELYQRYHTFKACLDDCADKLQRQMDKSLLSVLWGEHSHLLNETQYTQPALFALEYSLARLWQSWGVEPSVLIGHSIGEYVAACVAGVFSLEDGLKLIAARGRLMAELCQRGGMLSVSSSVENVKNELSAYPDVSVAADNSPRQVVISGDKKQLDEISKNLSKQKLKTHPLDVSHGFHSPLMQVMLKDFRAIAETINYQSPGIKLISNVTGEFADGHLLNADYWVRHVAACVQFRTGVKTLESQNCDLVIEVGPKPILISLTKQTVDTSQWGCLPSLQENRSIETLLQSLAQCYVQGMNINWKNVYSEKICTKVRLPTYSFARERYWFKAADRPMLSQEPGQKTLLGKEIRLAGSRDNGAVQNRYFEKQFDTSDLLYLFDHCVADRAVMPGAAFAEIALHGLKSLDKDTTYILQSLAFHRPLFINNEIVIQTLIKPTLVNGDVEIEIWSSNESENTDWVLYASGKFIDNRNLQAGVDKIPDQISDNKDDKLALSTQEFYQWCDQTGYQYAHNFQVLKHLQVGETSAIAVASIPGSVSVDKHSTILHPVLLDGAFQTALALFKDNISPDDRIALPASIENLSVFQSVANEVLIDVRLLAEQTTTNDFICDIKLSDHNGTTMALIKGLKFSYVNKLNFIEHKDLSEKSIYDNFFYTPSWCLSVNENNVSTADNNIASTSDSKTLIVFPSSSSSLLTALVEQLKKEKTIVARYGENSHQESANEYILKVGDEAAVDKLIQEHRDIAQLIFLGGFHCHTDNYNVDSDKFDAYQKQGVEFLFVIIKLLNKYTLLDHGFTLKVITNWNCPVNQDDLLIPWGGGLLGLSTVFAKENPDVESIGLDVDWCGDEDSERVAQHIIAEASARQGGVVAFRTGQRYTLKNQLTALKPADTEDLPLETNATYVIVGGAGGIGFVFSRYLVENYSANIAWIGRRSSDQEIEAKITELENSGGRISYYQCDACNLESMNSTVKQIEKQCGPIQGVVHSALQLNDHAIANMSQEEFKTSFDVKAKVTWVLQEIFQNHSLDFMLYFSSSLAFFNNPGQCNYIAGCVFQDNFAHYQKINHSVPVKIINWGYWSSVGAVTSAEYARLLNRIGFESIEIHEGIEAFERVLASPAPQIMAVKASVDSLKAMSVENATSMCWLPKQKTVDLVALSKTIPQRGFEISWSKLEESYTAVNRWSAFYVLHAFHVMGIPSNKISVFKQDNNHSELKEKLAIVDRHDLLLGACLDILQEQNIINQENNEIVFTDDHAIWAQTLDIDSRRLELEKAYPWLIPIMTLMWKCGEQFVNILTGHIAATEVIFPDSSLHLVEDYYRHDPVVAHRNKQMADAVPLIVKARTEKDPGRKFRILEIGAGTGATSRIVLPQLFQFKESIEYIYTDLSLAFLDHGKKSYGKDFPFVSYELLNIENSPASQGFEAGSVDLILATNVLHATTNIAETLKNIKYLLNTDGVLVANETTIKQNYLTLIFGLLDGWWLTNDNHYRIPHTPLLSTGMWRAALLNEQYVNTTFPKVDEASDDSIWQHLVIAQSNGYIPAAHQIDAQKHSSAAIGDTVTENKIFDRTIKELIQDSRENVLAYYMDYLQQTVGEILHIDQQKMQSLSKSFQDISLTELGLDSLLSIELRNRLRLDLAMDLPVQAFITNKVFEIVDSMNEQLLIKQLEFNQSASDESTLETDEAMETFVL